MDTVATQTPSLPLLVLYIGAIGGIAVSLIEIVRFTIFLLNRPKLEIRLTKEIFFRLTNEGESLFANAVLMSKGGTSEIKNVFYELHRKKENSSSKDFVIEILWYGKKSSDSSQIFADHHFSSKSPVDYITVNKVTRQLHFCALKEKRHNIKKFNEEFTSSILDYKNENLPSNKEELSELIQANSDTLLNAVNFANDQVEKYSLKILECVELEEGDYTLDINVTYTPLDWLESIRRFKFFRRIPNLKQRKSSITFKVGEFRERYKSELVNMMRNQAFNVLFPGANLNTDFPSFEPEDIQEKP